MATALRGTFWKLNASRARLCRTTRTAKPTAPSLIGRSPMSFVGRAIGVFGIGVAVVLCRSGYCETADETSATEPVPTMDSQTLPEAGYTAAQWKDRQSPRYPQRQFRHSREGWVQLDFTVDQAGKAHEIAVVASKGHKAFQRAAMDALRRSTFEPTAPGELSRHTARYDFEIHRPRIGTAAVQTRPVGRLKSVPRMRYDLRQEHRRIPH